MMPLMIVFHQKTRTAKLFSALPFLPHTWINAFFKQHLIKSLKALIPEKNAEGDLRKQTFGFYSKILLRRL